MRVNHFGSARLFFGGLIAFLFVPLAICGESVTTCLLRAAGRWQ